MCYKILPKDTESASEVSRMYHLVYCDDFLDFGYFLLEYSFDAHPHCHLGAGAALAAPRGQTLTVLSSSVAAGSISPQPHCSHIKILLKIHFTAPL